MLVIFAFFFEKYKADMSITNKIYYVLVLMACLTVAYLLFLIAERHTKSVKKYIKKSLGLTLNG